MRQYFSATIVISIPLFIQKIKEDVQLQEEVNEEAAEKEEEEAAEKEAEVMADERLNCCSVNYLAGWIGVMILALYLCIDATILEYSL